MTETQSTPGHGQGWGQLPPITDPYTTIGGETLPEIAERAGHSGEWQALALANLALVDDPDATDDAKAAVIAERAGRAGVDLALPSGWAAATKPAARTSSTRTTTTTTT